jgi:drug/metabolite transporter (DMT)-like permease
MRKTGHDIGPEAAGKGVYILAVLSMLFWGLSFVWSTIVFKYYSPIATIFLRLILSSIILSLYILIRYRPKRINPGDYKLFLLSGLLNPFLYFIGENYGLKFSTPTISAVVIATIPVFTPVAAYIAIRERVSLLNLAGIMLSFMGIIVMLINPDMSINAGFTGLSFLFLAVVTAVIYSVVVKKLVLKYSALTISTTQNILGVFYFLPIFLIFDLRDFLATPITWALGSNLLMLAIFASSLAFIFFVEVIGKIGVSRANVFSNLIPVFTAIFSLIFVGESFTPAKIAGMAIVMMGVIVTQVRPKRLFKQSKK